LDFTVGKQVAETASFSASFVATRKSSVLDLVLVSSNNIKVWVAGSVFWIEQSQIYLVVVQKGRH